MLEVGKGHWDLALALFACVTGCDYCSFPTIGPAKAIRLVRELVFEPKLQLGPLAKAVVAEFGYQLSDDRELQKHKVEQLLISCLWAWRLAPVLKGEEVERFRSPVAYRMNDDAACSAVSMLANGVYGNVLQSKTNDHLFPLSEDNMFYDLMKSLTPKEATLPANLNVTASIKELQKRGWRSDGNLTYLRRKIDDLVGLVKATKTDRQIDREKFVYKKMDPGWPKLSEAERQRAPVLGYSTVLDWQTEHVRGDPTQGRQSERQMKTGYSRLGDGDNANEQMLFDHDGNRCWLRMQWGATFKKQQYYVVVCFAVDLGAPGEFPAVTEILSSACKCESNQFFCHHIAATLYFLMCLDRRSISTDKLCTWNVPGGGPGLAKTVPIENVLFTRHDLKTELGKREGPREYKEVEVVDWQKMKDEESADERIGIRTQLFSLLRRDYGDAVSAYEAMWGPDPQQSAAQRQPHPGKPPPVSRISREGKVYRFNIGSSELDHADEDADSADDHDDSEEQDHVGGGEQLGLASQFARP